jgi:PAT family beta-lactamase induction signal transducer AmpG
MLLLGFSSGLPFRLVGNTFGFWLRDEHTSLAAIGFTATQYALLSSSYAWLGKILKGFSGAEVESLSATHGLIHAYGIFFIACGLSGVPAVLLFAALDYWHRRKQPVAAVGLQSKP